MSGEDAQAAQSTQGIAEGSSGAMGAEAEPAGDLARGAPILALRALPIRLDPLGALDPWAERLAADLVFQGLTRRDPSGAPWAKPDLADRCLALATPRVEPALEAGAAPGEAAAPEGPETGGGSGGPGPRPKGGAGTSGGEEVPAEGGSAEVTPGVGGGSSAPDPPTGAGTSRQDEAAGAASREGAPSEVAGAATLARRVLCHIPRGRRFHDGAEVTMEDVVYSLRAMLDPRRRELRRALGLGTWIGLEVRDAPPGAPELRDPGRWVELRFERPTPLALEKLAAVRVVPRARHRGRAGAFARAPVGSGPMRVKTMSADRIELERWPPSSRGAALPGLVLRAVADGAERLRLLRRGQVQLIHPVAPIHVPDELGRPGMAPRVRAYLLTPPRYDLVVFNLRRRVLADEAVRRALDAALPRAAVAGERAGGLAAPALAPVDLSDPVQLDLERIAELGPGARLGRAGLPPPVGDGLPGAGPEDPEAGAILQAAGWVRERGVLRRKGELLRVTLLWDGSRDAAPVAQAVRKAWAALGVVAPQASAAWSFLRQGPLAQGTFDAALLRLATGSDADLAHFFGGGPGISNISGVYDEDLKAALEAYWRAADRRSRDQAKRDVARRLAALRVAPVLFAPAEILLVSRELQLGGFVDDLPALDTLGWAKGP